MGQAFRRTPAPFLACKIYFEYGKMFRFNLRTILNWKEVTGYERNNHNPSHSSTTGNSVWTLGFQPKIRRGLSQGQFPLNFYKPL